MSSEKLPPHDIDAEEAVIGSLLIDGTAIYKIATFLQQPDFYHEQNQWLYGACLALYERPEREAINQITVAQELDRQGKLEACGGAAYLSHLISIVPTSLDIEHYAQIVYRLAISRRLIGAARQIEAIGYQADPDVDTSLNKAEDVLFRLRHGQSPRDFVHIRQILDKYFEEAAPGPTPEWRTTKKHSLIRSPALLDWMNFWADFSTPTSLLSAADQVWAKAVLSLISPETPPRNRGLV